MAKKHEVNKTEAVTKYLKSHPKATSGEITAALTKQGVKITANYAANIKSTINKGRKTKKSAKQTAVVETAAPAVETPTKAGNTLTIEQVKKVAQLIKTLGGQKRVNEVLETIKELGGVKKFKELVEAISGTEAVAIPF